MIKNNYAVIKKESKLFKTLSRNDIVGHTLASVISISGIISMIIIYNL